MKPKITKFISVWICKNNLMQAIGDTPKEAYEDWLTKKDTLVDQWKDWHSPHPKGKSPVVPREVKHDWLYSNGLPDYWR